MEYDKKIMKISIYQKILFSLYLILTVNINASQILSAGMKVGYEFGENGGFLIGGEISYVNIDQNFVFYGVVIGTNWNPYKHKIVPYFEAEGGATIIGTALGIQIENKIKFRQRLFIGAGILFVSIATTYDRKFELAGLLKYPYWFQHDGFNILKFDFKMPM